MLCSVCVLSTSPVLCSQIAMPNLKPPVTTTDEALAYRQVSAHALHVCWYSEKRVQSIAHKVAVDHEDYCALCMCRQQLD